MTAYSGVGFALYYHSETVEGTPNTSVTYPAISQHTKISISYKDDVVTAHKSGSADPAGSAAGKHFAMLKVEGAASTDFLTFLLSYGSSDTSVTLVATNGSKTYTIAGAKVAKWNAKASGPAAGATSFDYSLEFEGWSVTMTLPTGFSAGTIASGFISQSDVTTFTIGGSSTIFRSFDVTVDNELDHDTDQAGAITAIIRGTRKHSAKVSITSPATVTDFTTLGAGTTKTLVIGVSGLTITCTNMLFEEVGDDIDPAKIITRDISMTEGGAISLA